MARTVIPHLAVLRLGPVLPPSDPERLAELVKALRGGEDDRPDDDTHDPRVRDRDLDELVADATHLMRAAMQPAAQPTMTMAASAVAQLPLFMSLRWALNPAIGFPRAPFRVWRRRRKEDPTTPVAGSAPRSAPTTFSLSSQVLEVRFRAEPQPGRILTVEALASNGHVLPGQRLAFTGNGDGRFRAAGISALRLTGFGQVSQIGGLPQTAYANLADWTLIDVVGFPFAKSEIVPPDYDPTPQGRAAPSLDGVDAALARLRAGELIQRDPPAPGGGLATPAWPFPDPATFLDVLRKTALADVHDCLVNSVDDDPTRLQILHKPVRTLAGMHQPGVSTPSTTADLSMKTTHFIGLAVTDNPVALGLGFGTFDVATTQAWGDQGAAAAGDVHRLDRLHGHGRDHHLVRVQVRPGRDRVPPAATDRAHPAAGHADLRQPSADPRHRRLGLGPAELGADPRPGRRRDPAAARRAPTRSST